MPVRGKKAIYPEETALLNLWQRQCTHRLLTIPHLSETKAVGDLCLCSFLAENVYCRKYRYSKQVRVRNTRLKDNSDKKKKKKYKCKCVNYVCRPSSCTFNCIYVKTGLQLQCYVTALSRFTYHVISNRQAKCLLKYAIYLALLQCYFCSLNCICVWDVNTHCYGCAWCRYRYSITIRNLLSGPFKHQTTTPPFTCSMKHLKSMLKIHHIYMLYLYST